MSCFLAFPQEVSDVWQKVNCAFTQRGRCHSRGKDTLSGGSIKVWLSCGHSCTCHCVKMHRARVQVSLEPLSSPDPSPCHRQLASFSVVFLCRVEERDAVLTVTFTGGPHMGPAWLGENCWGFWKDRLVTFHKLTTLEPNLSYSSSLKPIHCTI